MEQVVLHKGKKWNWVAALAPYWKYHTMLVPNRHISKISEINAIEWKEFLELHDKIIELYKESDIRFDDSTQMQNILVFWRQRYQLYNSVLGTNNVSHLHIHFASDREHFLDPISDDNATSWDIDVFKDKIA